MDTPKKTEKHNIVIQGVSEGSIKVQVDGEVQEIHNKLDALRELLEKLQVHRFQTADKIYNIGSISQANFDFVIRQSGHDRSLPGGLAFNLITDKNRWVQSLRQELLKQNVAVGNRPLDIIQHYGWLIAEFLRKMLTADGQKQSLRALSFMAEAYQSSLRYLCYIQVAQILKMGKSLYNPFLAEYLNMPSATVVNGKTIVTETGFDYLNLLLISTELLSTKESFVPELRDFVAELSDTRSELYGAALFLDKHRRQLLENGIAEDAKLSQLMTEYLTGLVFWLRKLAFLARYRLVSIKDISLSYRLGTPKNFVHLYGELHGMYNFHQDSPQEEDYDTRVIEGVFTYNQSVLLFKGSNITACLDKISDPETYLSLSPLVIDQSVFADTPTQTPEIYYYIGRSSKGRQCDFAQYKNELAFGNQPHLPSNKTLSVRAQNNNRPKLNELFEHLEKVFHPFKTTSL